MGATPLALTNLKPVVLPQVDARGADAHAHLAMLDDPAGALERASLAGVVYIVTSADLAEMPEGTMEGIPVWQADAAERFANWGIEGGVVPEVRVVTGLHPHNAKSWSDEYRDRLLELLNEPLVAAVGETGLDFYYTYSPRQEQERAFRDQLEIAIKRDVPIVVHLRDAHDEGAAILREMGIPKKGCVIHCFTEGPELAEQFLEMGCHVSFSGTVTFGKSESLRRAVLAVPFDRLLIETDCPFLAPAPYRGRPNEPAWSMFTVAKIAQIRGVQASRVAAAGLANAVALFGTTVAAYENPIPEIEEPEDTE